METLTTIYDVAKSAGVSPKTVSRVINGDAHVGVATREKVERAIDALNYAPSHAARLMRTAKSGLIGVITTAISNTSELDEPTGLPDLYLVQGLQQVLAGARKTVMIADTMGVETEASNLMRTFEQYRVEGIIYVADFHKELQVDVSSTKCPVVLLNCFDAFGTPSVLPDDEGGQFALVQRLIKEGHRRIAYFSLPLEMEAGRLRVQGYKAALEAHEIDVDEQLICQGFDMSLADRASPLDEAIGRILALENPPSVFCCGNDEMALRVYGLLRKRGYSLPEDFSVAGYDNYRAIAKTLIPTLTTVELPYTEMGKQAASQLLSMIEAGHSSPRSTEPKLVSGSVVWRSSVTRPNQTE